MRFVIDTQDTRNIQLAYEDPNIVVPLQAYLADRPPCRHCAARRRLGRPRG